MGTERLSYYWKKRKWDTNLLTFTKKQDILLLKKIYSKDSYKYNLEYIKL